MSTTDTRAGMRSRTRSRVGRRSARLLGRTSKTSLLLSPAYILLVFWSVAFACSASRGIYMTVMFAHGRAFACVECVEVSEVAWSVRRVRVGKRERARLEARARHFAKGHFKIDFEFRVCAKNAKNTAIPARPGVQDSSNFGFFRARDLHSKSVSLVLGPIFALHSPFKAVVTRRSRIKKHTCRDVR